MTPKTPKLPSLIRQWFGKSATQAAAKPSGFRPEIELLEMREVPAGLVTATFASGTLTITGDAADNDITVTGAVGTYSITGNNGTTVNTGGPFSNVATIKIAMGSGTDIVGVQADTLTNLSIDGGTGSNTADVSLNNVTGTLSLLNNDYNYVYAAGSGDLTLKTVNVSGGGTGSGSGPGTTYTVFGTNPGGNLTISGALTAKHGASYDYLLVGAGSGYSAGNIKLGSVSVNNGDGGSQTVIGSQYSYGSGSAPTNITVTGALSITNGAGSDINLIGTGSGYSAGNIKLNSVTINNGDGGSQTVIGNEYAYGYASGSSSLTIAGAVNITNGAGDNYNAIGGGYYGYYGYYGQGLNVALTSVTITNGSGDAQNILSAYNGSLTATGAVKITNGDGYHYNQIYSVAGYYYGSGSGSSLASLAANLSLKDVTILNGKGYSQNYIYAYNGFYGSGAGSGSGSAGSMTISGNTTITNGDGYGENYIGSVTGDYYSQVPVTKVVGAVTISNGYGSGFTILGSYYGYDLGSGAPQQFTGPITISGKGVGSGLGSGSGIGDLTGQGVFLNGIAATKTVKVTLGDTDDYVDIESSSFAQPVTIATGGGNDYVSLGASSSFLNTFGTSFNYPVGVLFAPPALSVDLGAGDDVLVVGTGSGGPGATFLGALFNGGAGYDELYQYSNGTQTATLDQNFEYKTGSGTPPEPPIIDD